MADEYIVASSDGDLFVTDISGISANTSFYCTLDDIDGDYTNPNPKWERTEMYLHLYASGGYAYAEYLPYGSTPQTTSLTSLYPYIVLSAYNVMENNVKMLKIAWATGSNMREAIQNIQGGYGMLLYSDTMDNATSGGIASVYDNHWEDPVDPGYNPGQSQGGSEADLGDITSDDMDDGFLMPFEPWANETENDHGGFRMMQPYLMDQSQWNIFEDLFWADADDSNSVWHKILDSVFNGTTDPLSAIAGLIRIPIPPSAIPVTAASGTTVRLFIGGVRIDGSSGYWIRNRYVKLQYGLALKEVFGTYMDYTETQIQLYLPYVSTVDIDAASVMDSTLRITYIVDVWTGDLICTLNVYKNAYGKNLNSIIGRWKGNCAQQMIYSRANTQQHAQNLVNGFFGMAGGVMSGNYLGAVQSGLNMAMDQRIKTEKYGNLSGASGWCDLQVPYLIIKRNVPLMPEDWRKLKGAEQNATFTVNQLSGYTEFEEIHVHISMGITPEEKDEIESILKTGVIL